MATSISFNGTTYSIPAEGELAWSALSAFLVDVGNNAAVAEEMKQAIRVATSSPVTVSATTDCTIATDLSVAGAVTVNLPAGINRQIFIIADGKGDATTNNVTINRNGSDTIAGATSLVLNHNRQAVALQYHAATTDWKILYNNIAPGTVSLTSDVTGVLPVANGGTGITSFGTGVATFLGTPSSANLAAALTDETGSGAAVFATSPTLVTPALGTPSSGTLTNCTGLPVSTGVSGLGSNVATFLATPSSANLAAALTDETGSGGAVFATSPTLVTPALGTPSAAVLTNATGLPLTTGTTGVLPETKGGTNQSTYASGDTLYASASNTLSKLAIGSAGQVLTVAAGLPSWGTSAVVPGTAGNVYSDGSALQSVAFSGNANKVFGVNSGATSEEAKSILAGTSGTDFAVAHAAGSITLNLPDAGASARGVVTTGTQTFAGAKTFAGNVTLGDANTDSHSIYGGVLFPAGSTLDAGVVQLANRGTAITLANNAEKILTTSGKSSLVVVCDTSNNGMGLYLTGSTTITKVSSIDAIYTFLSADSGTGHRVFKSAAATLNIKNTTGASISYRVVIIEMDT